MFRLEKLEIIGFKSFAERTTLVFGEGITGVVGPNGCGKSNIAEAISWVLGEQSAKNMRGGKMEDVIFNGTRDRKPTGLAEVLLTMVAIEDIAARDSDEAENGDEQEFDQALTNAQRAADSARSLVDELAAQEEQLAAPSEGRASDSPDDTTEPLTPPDHVGYAALGQESETSSTPDESSAEIQSDPSVSQLEVQPPATDAGVEGDSIQPKKRRSPRPLRRRRIAISAGERVVVGRRLYRTGDSDYLMNGRPCLLRDVQDLFAGTGLGGAHYAIIEQGRIGQILSSKPLDRRGLIEEAAGITKFKSRKRAAELKLESAKQNLTRLNDIISEIERQVNSLKRQAQKARRHRRLREEMRSLMKVVFTSDHYRLRAAIERVGRDLEEAGRNQDDLDSKLTDRETEHRGVSAHARSAEDRLAGLREQASALELEADRARNRRTFAEQQIRELGARIEELNRDQQAFDTRLSMIDEEAKRRGDGLRALEAELADAQACLLAREGEYQAELSQLRQADAAIEMLRQRMVAEIGATERLRNLGASLTDSLKRLDLKQSNLQAEFERAAARRNEAESEHSRVQSEAEHGGVQLSELTGRIAERAAEVITLRDERNSLRSEIEKKQAERNAAQHRLASLEDLDAHRAYYSDAVQQVLSPEQAARINALGTLADFVEVESQYEALVESLFGRELQSVLVPTIDDALAGVDYIKTEELGRGAFLVVGLHGGQEDGSDSEGRESDDIQEHDEESRGDWGQGPVFEVDENGRVFDSRSEQPPLQFHLEVLRAIDLLELRPEIKTVVEHAFPEKCGAAVVPDLEAALQLSIENQSRIYVTSDGEMVINGRLIVTGAQAGQRGTSLLGLKREIKALRIQTQALGIEQERFTAAIDRVELRLGGMEGEAATLDAELREHEKSAAARNSQLEGLARDLERARQHARVVEIELEQTRDERREHEERSEQVVLDLSAAEASRLSVQAALDEAQSSLARMRVGAEQLSEQLSGARASAAALGERLHAARAEMRRIESETEELNSRINRNRLELYESHGRIDELTASHAEAESALALFESDRASLDEGINAATGELQAARARADELESLLSEMRQTASAARDRRGEFEVERARIESETEHLARMCLSELAMSLEDVVTSVEISGQWPLAGDQAPEVRDQLESPEHADELGSSDDYDEKPAVRLATALGPDDSDAGKARLDELRRKLDEIGPVNMMALEELEDSEQRFKFLSEQRRDILDSIRMTEEALAEIRRRSRERFRHAFTHINENFRQMFVELFGGGRGEMTLIDEDDVLESGIDLIAQPPGKRLQNVLLLSGGEKAMAAIALVLAIFQYRPSPFCILDEVDAPLDEVNVGRFSEKVIEMSRDTQFLVITHNKRTMEAARALYGVTMEQPGVSKLVSVKFE